MFVWYWCHLTLSLSPCHHHAIWMCMPFALRIVFRSSCNKKNTLTQSSIHILQNRKTYIKQTQPLLDCVVKTHTQTHTHVLLIFLLIYASSSLASTGAPLGRKMSKLAAQRDTHLLCIASTNDVSTNAIRPHDSQASAIFSYVCGAMCVYWFFEYFVVYIFAVCVCSEIFGSKSDTIVVGNRVGLSLRCRPCANTNNISRHTHTILTQAHKQQHTFKKVNRRFAIFSNAIRCESYDERWRYEGEEG